MLRMTFVLIWDKFRASMNTFNTQSTPEDILYRYWGFRTFRDFQQGPVRDLCAGRDVLAILPTGGGKTVCYQVPGLYRGGLCLVISPLIALMKDQIEGLRSKGIRCDAVTAEGGPRDAERALENAAVGALQFLYVSPERLKSEAFLARLDRMPIQTVAIDEAHCISQWGHDFRPAYRDLATLRSHKPHAVWGAFTATATAEVFDDIAVQLQLKSPAKHRSNMRRPNLHYGVCASRDAAATLIESAMKASGTGLVYVGTRIAAERWADRLKRAGISAEAYHAGLDGKLKADRQRRWIAGELRVMACTSAFGMGIDKPDVRWVYHAHIPADLESYVQEAGRAGRDGLPSECILFPDAALVKETEERIEQRFPSESFVRSVYQGLANAGRVAVGDHPDEAMRFSPQAWAQEKGVSGRAVHAALALLAAAQFIEVRERTEHPAGTWVQLATQAQCAAWIEERAWGWELLDRLRRSPQALSGVAFDPTAWAQQHHRPVQEVIGWMERWDRMGIGEWKPAASGLRIRWLMPRMAAERLALPKSIYSERQAHLQSKWQAMKDYIEAPACRATFLDAYFGTLHENGPCGTCDRCACQEWNGAEWARNNIPDEGVDGHELMERIPPLMRDCGIQALRTLREEGLLYSQGSRVFLTR